MNFRRPHVPDRGQMRSVVQLGMESWIAFAEPRQGLTIQPADKLKERGGEKPKGSPRTHDLAFAVCHTSSEHYREASVKGSCYKEGNPFLGDSEAHVL